jgi:hypothetical protein
MVINYEFFEFQETSRCVWGVMEESMREVYKEIAIKKHASAGYKKGKSDLSRACNAHLVQEKKAALLKNSPFFKKK